jgi:DNA-binding MarR family transcriptional regulator
MEVLPPDEEPDTQNDDDHSTILDFDGYARATEVIEATRLFQHRMEVAVDQALEGFAVSFAQYRALEIVADRPAHISYIARKVRVTRQAAESVVNKLARAGLVDLTRLGNFTDVEITPQGTRWLHSMRTGIEQLVGGPIERELTPRELRHLLLLTRKADGAIRPHRRPMWWLAD